VSHKGTTVVFPGGEKIIFPERLTEAEAVKRAYRIRQQKQNPVQDPVQLSIDKYEEFNFRAPRELARLKVDLKTPLIRIGTVPEIHYNSTKEGEPVHYVHFVKRKGTLYGHPSGKMFLLVGGSTRIRDWLVEENPKHTPDAVFAGWQRGIDNKPMFALYNVTRKDHPLFKSTVSAKTLRKHKLRVPRTPKATAT